MECEINTKEKRVRLINITTRVSQKILSVILAAFVAMSCVLMTATTLKASAESEDFSPRTTAPRGNQYYTTMNDYYKTGYGMPNCTAYAWGRAYEILKSKPKLCMGNAYEWYGYNKRNGYYNYGRSPRLGAIACWSRGHVAVVEKIVGDTITISESHYSGRYFDTKNLKKGNESSYCGNFQGYIYIL